MNAWLKMPSKTAVAIIIGALIIITALLIINNTNLQNEHGHSIPYFLSASSYVAQSQWDYCGPASALMILKYSNCPNLPTQDELAEEMQCPEHNGTFPSYIHLPFDSRNLTDYIIEDNDNVTYNAPYNGFNVKCDYNFTYASTELEINLNENHPVILCTWFNDTDTNASDGHFMVATGYNSTGIFVDDPWNSSNTEIHPWSGYDVFINNIEFERLWSFDGDWMFIYEGN